jgi:uncharacterized membrane protein
VSVSTERVLLLCFIAVGICLRFTSLDRKVYWYDEAFTSLEISGYSPREATADILTGRMVSGAELEKYQFLRANSPKSTFDTVKGLIANEPQLTPAYFVTLRWWSGLFPDSIAAIRALSAILSVIALVASFWLCRELFPSLRVAYVCVALIATSPFHLLYAQEARPYSMWIVTTLLSGAFLLRALRRQTVVGWVLYAMCTALSLYTFLLSILVLAGQVCFVAIENRFRITAAVKAFSISALAATASFLLWPYRGQHSGAGNDHYSLMRFAIKWIRSVGILFADFNLRNDTPKSILVPYSILLIALLALCGYSLYFVNRFATRTQATFLLTLIASICLPLLALDAMNSSSVSLVTRYLFPCLVGLQVAVAYLLATKASETRPARSRAAWHCCLALLLAIGLASCMTFVRANEWWNKDPENYVQGASRLINSGRNPVVVVSDSWFVPLLSLEHKLRSDIRYQLTVEPNVPDVYKDAGTIFAIKPSAHFRTELGRRFSFELVDRSADLWRLTVRVDSDADLPQ